MLGASMTAEARASMIRANRRRALVGGSIAVSLGAGVALAFFAWTIVLPVIGLLWVVGWL